MAVTSPKDLLRKMYNVNDLFKQVRVLASSAVMDAWIVPTIAQLTRGSLTQFKSLFRSSFGVGCG